MLYLKVWTSFREVIAPLSDAEKGRLFDAMLMYAETGEEPILFEGNERFLWPAAKQGIDQTALKNAVLQSNGSKGGRPKTKENQTEPNETKENQTEANESHKEKKSKENKCKVNKFISPTVEEVAAYCRERGNSVDAQTFVDFYSSKGWKVGNSPMKDWKACVRTWERNRGSVTPIKTVAAQQYTQRNYDNEQAEAMKRMLEGYG